METAAFFSKISFYSQIRNYLFCIPVYVLSIMYFHSNYQSCRFSHKMNFFLKKHKNYMYTQCVRTYI